MSLRGNSLSLGFDGLMTPRREVANAAESDLDLAAQKIVLVHGLWMGAWAMRPLAARLRSAGHTTRIFNYPTRTRGVRDNARRLADSIRNDNESTTVRIVAHSLGGLVTLHALRHLNEIGGTVVLLGSPINGSATAERFANWPGAQLLIGQARSGLAAPVPEPSASWNVSMIAGTRRLGLGVIVSPKGEAGDGTVALAETRAKWLRRHIEMPETHSSLLVSPRVSAQVLELFSAEQPGQPTRAERGLRDSRLREDDA